MSSFCPLLVLIHIEDSRAEKLLHRKLAGSGVTTTGPDHSKSNESRKEMYSAAEAKPEMSWKNFEIMIFMVLAYILCTCGMACFIKFKNDPRRVEQRKNLKKKYCNCIRSQRKVNHLLKPKLEKPVREINIVQIAHEES